MRNRFALVRNAIALVALISSLVTLPPAHAAASGKSSSATSSQRSEAQNGSTYPFEFHSGFWINLHHFLYEQALARKRAAKNETMPKSVLSTGQQKLWDAALDYYLNNLIKRDLLMDQGMVTMNDQLAEAEGARDLSKSGLSAELVKVLESVAPIYRSRWWEQHDKANRFWIAVVTPMVQQFSRTLISQLTAAYKAKWPTDTLRVEVVEYANWAGAYTTFDKKDRVHITVDTDSGNQGFAALEILFHEASHSMVSPNNGAVASAIARESKAQNKAIPDGLWHAIIFYTAGEFTRRNLKEYGVTDYIPYGYRGLYERAWPKLQRPLELYWQPYLDGTVDFDKAMSNLINAL